MESFRDLMRLSHGFELAKIFLVAVELDLFSHLRQERTASELAQRLGIDGRALELCLNALAAAGLLVKEGEGFRNRPLADRCLVAGDDYRGHIFRHLHHCWDSWHELREVVRSGRPATIRENQALGESEMHTRNFIRGMDDVTRELAPEVVGQLGLSGGEVVLDVGGGPGRYARAFLAAGAGRVILYDLPGALAVARDNLARWGIADRVELVAGDFHRDPLPPGADLVWVSQILHSQSEDQVRALLSRIFAGLHPGGEVGIHEFLLDDHRAGPLQAALFAVHMLVMTEGGRAYCGAELGRWLEEAGFAGVRVQPGGPETRVVRAHKPK